MGKSNWKKIYKFVSERIPVSIEDLEDTAQLMYKACQEINDNHITLEELKRNHCGVMKCKDKAGKKEIVLYKSKYDNQKNLACVLVHEYGHSIDKRLVFDKKGSMDLEDRSDAECRAFCLGLKAMPLDSRPDKDSYCFMVRESLYCSQEIMEKVVEEILRIYNEGETDEQS